jgi:hypothetical protein
MTNSPPPLLLPPDAEGRPVLALLDLQAGG